MTQKPPAKAKLTDEERHKRFVELAREVEASEDEKDLDKALERVTNPSPPSDPKGVR